MIVRVAFAAAVLLAAAPTVAEARPLRVMSLDQCGDQYALALAPEADLALSPRADDPDSFLRREAAGRRRIRPTLEAAVAFRPDVVVRYWGGDPRLLARLERSGARIVNLDDATDFDGIRGNVRKAAAALNAEARGEALVRRMDGKLASAAAPKPAPKPALYLTAGGFTAGAGTLVDAILRAAGLRNAAEAPGYAPVSVERIALQPPRRFVLGFFDLSRSDWRGPGRHPVVRKATEGRVAARLPASTLTCPAWFAADAAALIKDAR